MKKDIKSGSMWRVTPLGVILLIFLASGGATSAQLPDTRYSHATKIKLRAKPAGDAAVISQWSINQAMTLVRQYDKHWCEVVPVGGSEHGFLDCRFLGTEPLSLEQIELDAAAEVLSLNRLTVTSDIYSTPRLLLGANPDVVKSFEKLLLLLERHFAISPSLHTYADYSRVLQVILSEVGDSDGETDKRRLALKNLAQSRMSQLSEMRTTLSQDFAARSFAPVRHSIGHRLNLLLQQRRFGASSGKVKPRRGQDKEFGNALGGAVPASGESFFSNGKWAAGWAGGGLVKRMRATDPQAIAYSVQFDGTGPWALADVYEMAKALHVPVTARFGKMVNPDGLSYATSTAGSGVETLILDLSLPVWAITERGLVAGTVRRVSFGGDACAGETKVPTAVEMLFPAPVKGGIYGVFVTSSPIEPSRAVVSVRKRTFLDALQFNFETTFTHRVDMSIDLDGDGVADLRTVVSNDLSVGAGPSPGFMSASTLVDRKHFRRVAGWYANDVYMLQANESGWWQTLSRYNLVTCT